MLQLSVYIRCLCKVLLLVNVSYASLLTCPWQEVITEPASMCVMHLKLFCMCVIFNAAFDSCSKISNKHTLSKSTS